MLVICYPLFHNINEKQTSGGFYILTSFGFLCYLLFLLGFINFNILFAIFIGCMSLIDLHNRFHAITRCDI